MNSSQFQRCTPDSVRIVNSQSAVSTSGVGPADSTGKSLDERLPRWKPIVALSTTDR